MPARPLARKLIQPFQRFFEIEAAGGIVLLVAAAVALLWANSRWSGSYERLWELPITLGVAPLAMTESLHLWINDGLMVVFFLLVGLEIKREALVGELASLKKSALPLAGAVGGMVVPAAIYASLNAGTPGIRGWGIPMATDIAFALGVLALLGSRAPTGLKVFLAALAITDDIGAVLVIAFFYTAQLSLTALAAAAVVLALLAAANRAGVRTMWVYAPLGIVLWVAFLKSGVHATVAGVLLAMTIPARTAAGEWDESRSPLLALEERLHGPVSFGIMPLFALANAGLHLDRRLAAAFGEPIALGVLLGLALGKPIGITAAAWATVRAGLAALPEGVSWRGLHGAAWLGGIGFTMSLFIAGLAFTTADALDAAKAGILAASAIAGIIGTLVLRLAARPPAGRNEQS
jgi:NhaA family Na+:H+ antiporter